MVRAYMTDLASDFIRKLIEWTINDSIVWYTSMFTVHHAVVDSFTIIVETPQDGRPYICINDVSLEGYDLGIQTLVTEIDAQHKRKELYVRSFQSAHSTTDDLKNLQKFQYLSEEVLKCMESPKPGML